MNHVQSYHANESASESDALALTLPNFLTYTNLYGFQFEISISFLAIFGFTFVMVLREIDLSVGSVYACSGVLSAYLLLNGMPFWGAVAVALLGGGAIGLINGWLVVRLRLNSLMLTIGTMLLVRGLVGVMTMSLRGNVFPREFRMLSRTRIFEVNTTIWIMAALLVGRWCSNSAASCSGKCAKSARICGRR